MPPPWKSSPSPLRHRRESRATASVNRVTSRALTATRLPTYLKGARPLTGALASGLPPDVHRVFLPAFLAFSETVCPRISLIVRDCLRHAIRGLHPCSSALSAVVPAFFRGPPAACFLTCFAGALGPFHRLIAEHHCSLPPACSAGAHGLTARLLFGLRTQLPATSSGPCIPTCIGRDSWTCVQVARARAGPLTPGVVKPAAATQGSRPRNRANWRRIAPLLS